jgi:hypothetical protein
MSELVAPLPWWPSRVERTEHAIGTVEVPSGRLVACDPLVIEVAPAPFARTLAPRTYPVRLGRADGDLAYAVLVVSEARVVGWEHAQRIGERPQVLAPRAPGFDVDASTGAYLDVQTAELLFRERFEDGRLLLDRLYDAGYRDGPWAEASIDGAPRLVAFGTGGDGRFASYWGLDAQGEPSVLVTDFGVLCDPDVDVAPERPLAKVIPFPTHRRKGT